MNWSQLSLVVDASQVDLVSTILDVFLAKAVTTENAGQVEFYEIAFPGTPDWEKVTVTGLFEEQVDVEPIIEFIHSQLSGQEVPTSIAKLVDQDWARVWLSSFKPIQVGTKLWVCPSWCEPVDADARNIILDPGLAFGTGTHATTAMCLNWLSEKNLSMQNVLDYGSGSGILAIAAVFSGAVHADAVDIDPLAVTACKDNAERNGVADRVIAYLPDQIGSDSQQPRAYDLVIANILAEVIIELRDILLVHLKPDGRLLLTGILNTQADRVIAAFGDDYNFEKKIQDQWCLLASG
ncbi:MAG: ribosomal protein L11 methyltransferase [Arenicella sp.]|jgi:ribosomal protein L11 methyltransferase